MAVRVGITWQSGMGGLPLYIGKGDFISYVSALQKCEEDSTVSSISSSEGTSHFQVDLDLLEETNPKIVLALKSSKHDDLELTNVLLLDNQSTFDLCCNKRFTSQIFKAKSPLLMTSNGDKIPEYKSQVWFSSKAIHHYMPQELDQVLQGHL